MHRHDPSPPPLAPPPPPAAAPEAGPAPSAIPVPAPYLPPTHGQLALLLGYLGGGLLLTLAGAVLAGTAGWLLGLFLCCHAAIVAASWLPPQVLSRRLDRWLDRWVADIGGGFYGLMALSLFVGLEAASLVDEVRGFELSIGAIAGALVPWLIGFSLDSLQNSLTAILWPGYLLSSLGVFGAAATVALAWGLFVLGARVFPQPAFMTAKRPPRKPPPPAS